MVFAGDYYGHSTSPLTIPKPVISRSSKTPRTSMDNDAEARRRGDDREAMVSGSVYGNHGIWPTLLHAFVVGLLLWRLKMSYSILGGDLDGTPVSKNIVIWTHVGTAAAALQALYYPGLALCCRLRNVDYVPSPKRHFVGGFLHCLANSINVLSTLAILATVPGRMDPAKPGYTVAAAREYRAWRNVDMPMYAMLSALVALLIVIDFTAWTRYDQWRKLEAEREIELRERTRRWRLMFDRPEHAGMVTGVMERAHPREGNKVTGAIA